MARHPLLQGLSSEEIELAAERWLALLSAQRLVWKTHAGFKGDDYPMESPDERFLSLVMWSHTQHPHHIGSIATHAETKELLTQFADKMREDIASSSASGSVLLSAVIAAGQTPSFQSK